VYLCTESNFNINMKHNSNICTINGNITYHIIIHYNIQTLYIQYKRLHTLKCLKSLKKIMSPIVSNQSKHNTLIFAHSDLFHFAKFRVLCYAGVGTVDGWFTQQNDADHNIKYVHTHLCVHISM